MDRKTDDRIGRVVGGKYRILEKIGGGSFGEIFKGKHLSSGDDVAVKFEPSSTTHRQLKHEASIYKALEKVSCFPRPYWYGEEGGYSILVIQLLGRSLEELFQRCHRRFSVKTVLLLADQMISSLELLHSKHYLHRDIKPENFVMGTGKHSADLYLIDFGLSKRFRDPATGLHIPYRDHKSFTGTARYASINTHIGIEQSRRDDLESVGHLFVYFLKGILPWQNLQAVNKKEKYEKIKNKKQSVSVLTLCKNIPSEFETYLSYCRNMKFNERPDYLYMKRLFKELFVNENYLYDQVYDWTRPHVHKALMDSQEPEKPLIGLIRPLQAIGKENTHKRKDPTQSSAITTTRYNDISGVAV